MTCIAGNAAVSRRGSERKYVLDETAIAGMKMNISLSKWLNGLSGRFFLDFLGGHSLSRCVAEAGQHGKEA